jgi:hypothetical protein
VAYYRVTLVLGLGFQRPKPTSPAAPVPEKPAAPTKTGGATSPAPTVPVAPDL